MNRVREAFNTSVHAQAAALAAIDDAEHARRSVDLVDREREWLISELEALGFDVVPSVTNFLFTDLGSRATEINQGLLERGIVIRPMTASGLESWARISIPARSDGERLVAALADVAS